MKDQKAQVELSAVLTPLPEIHLLKDMGHSLVETLFPWYLVNGLMALRDHANKMGGKSYEKYDSAMVK